MPHKDPKARRQYDAAWRARNREKCRQASRDFRARHRDASREYDREKSLQFYHAKQKHDPAYKAAALKRASAWYGRNQEKAKKRIASYRRNALIVPRQTPKWANRFFISEIYDLAKLRTKYLGIPHEVDHVIPLRGKNVCGLHVETNLRVVPKQVNRAKAANF